MKIYPAIDLIDGCCVRLHQGDFSAQTNYAPTPQEILAGYLEAGTQYLHVVDLDGARDARGRQRQLIGALCQHADLKVQVGGGVRAASDVEELLDAGASQVVVGSLAVRDVGATVDLLDEFGPERITLALDVRLNDAGVPCVATEAWRENSTQSLEAVIETYAAHGLRHVLCTDIGRDGTMEGPNAALYQGILDRYPNLALQASGGVQGLDDLPELVRMGCAAVIIGKALFEGRFTLSDALSVPGVHHGTAAEPAPSPC